MPAPDDRFQVSENYWQSKASLFSEIYRTRNPLLVPARLFLRQRQEIVTALLPKKMQGVALDVGCGSGEFVAMLARRFPKVIGSDYSEVMLKSARAAVSAANVEFIHADCAKLPFESGSVDFLSALGLLDYVADVEAAVREFRRVLKPGAEAVITLPKSPSFFAPLRWSQAVRGFLFNIPPILNIYPRKTLGALLERNGFESLEAIPLWTTMWILKVRAR